MSVVNNERESSDIIISNEHEHYQDLILGDEDLQNNNFNFQNVNNNRREKDVLYQASKTPRHISLVESWTSQHHGDGTYPKKSKTWRHISIVVLGLLAIVIVLWASLAYKQLKHDLDQNIEKLHYLAIEMQGLKTGNQMKVSQSGPRKQMLFKTPNPKPLQRKIAAINLCGKNDQLEMSRQGVAFYDWKKTLQKGDISYAHNYIIINVPGIYYVYAQMFFFVEKGTFKQRFLDFYISKNRRERLAVSLNPAASCPSSCTRSIARIVQLNKTDHLSVTSYTKDIPFKMSQDKSNFGVYLLKAD